MYTQDAHALIVVYDLTHTESLDAAQQYIEDVISSTSDPSNIVIALVGNKSDLIHKHTISFRDALKVKQAVGAEILLEVSAKDGQGVNQLFYELARELYFRFKRRKVLDNESREIRLKLEKEERNKERMVGEQSKKGCPCYN
jgi:GTPase SAR1 family protein